MINPRLKLLVSLIVGGLTAGFFWWHLAAARMDIKNQTHRTTVLRATGYVKKGQILTRDKVEILNIPGAYLQPTALQSKEQLLDSKGNPRYKVRMNLLKGEHVARSKLLDQKVNLGLAWNLRKGRSAVTFRFAAEQAVGGYLQPGDWVHLYGTHQSKTRLLLPGVQVLAVDDQLWDPLAPIEPENIWKAVAGESILITLDLSPQDGARAIEAEENGRLKLALNSPLEERSFSHE